MDGMTKEDTIRRLRSIAGHIQGIERMVEKDAYCIDVMKQVLAVQAALGKLNENILQTHLDTCVINAIRGDDPTVRDRVLGEITDVFQMTRKV
jgi:DNA-binding FrmR family transcriptional regulator